MPPRPSQSTSGPTKTKTINPCSASGNSKAQPATKRRKLALTAGTITDEGEDTEEYEVVDDSHLDKAVGSTTKKGRKCDSTTGPARKRYVKGKRGILQKITDTPLDVLFEVRLLHIPTSSSHCIVDFF